MRSAGVVFTEQGFTDSQPREIKVGTAALDCLGAKRLGRSDGVVYACFNPGSCILGDFEGSGTHLAAFYRTVATARYNPPQQTTP
jgi:hypothetical protein